MKTIRLIALVLFGVLGQNLHAQVLGDVIKKDVTNGQVNFVITKHSTSQGQLPDNEVAIREIWGNGHVEIPSTITIEGENHSSESYKVTATEGWNTIVQSKNVTSVVLPEGLTTIQSGSFQYVENSSNFDAIVLPSTLTTIGTRCFEGSLITKFYFTNGATSNAYFALDTREDYSDSDNDGTYSSALYTKDGKTLVLLAAGFGKNNTTSDNVHNDGNRINLSDYVIREGTTKIEKTAINYAGYLRKLTIPSSVNDIKVGQFVGDASIISSGTYFEATGRNDRTPKQNKEAQSKYTYFTHDGVLFHYYENGDDKGNALVAVPRKYTDVWEKADDYYISDDITIDVYCKSYGYWDADIEQYVTIPAKTYQVTLSGGHTLKYKALTDKSYLKPGKDQAQARYLKNYTETATNVNLDLDKVTTYFTNGELNSIISQLNQQAAQDGRPTITMENAGSYVANVKYSSVEIPYEGKYVFEFAVPEAVTAIASDAIIGVKYLEEIDLGPSTVTVSNYAIAQMGSLKKVDIEAHTTDIKEGAIVECSGIEQFWVDPANTVYTHDINPSVTDDPHFGVLYTKDGKNLKLYPNGKTSPDTYAIYYGTQIIEKQAFKGNKYIKDLTIPTTVKEIHEEAFRRFGLLTETSGRDDLTLTFDAQGSQLELIEMNAFKQSYFKNVTIPTSVKTIQNNAFELMPELVTVTFLDGCVIGDAVLENGYDFSGKPVQITKEGLGVASFRNNPKLTTVTFGSTPNLTTLTTNSFSADSALTSVKLPTSLKQIASNALQAAGGKYRTNGDLTNVTTINFAELTLLEGIGPYAFAGSNIGSNINLNNGKLTTIDAQAFDHCQKMKSIQLPRTLWWVADGAFTFCTALESIDVIHNPNETGGPGVCAYISIDGMLCSSDKTRLHTFPGGKGDTDYALLPYIKYVADYAFYGCQKLTSIVFPKTIESIGFRALAKCKNLKSISFMGDWVEGGANDIVRLNDDNMYRVTTTDNEPNTPLSKDISINVRKNWFDGWFKTHEGQTADENPLVYYAAKFKAVNPSFYVDEPKGGTNYDRDLEFFQLSETEVGVVGMKKSDNGALRRSVIINSLVNTPTDYHVILEDIYKEDPKTDLQVKAILDFAFAETSRLNTVIVLPEIDYIGASAFTGAADIDRVFLAGNTKAPAFISETLQMDGTYFKGKTETVGGVDKTTGYYLNYNPDNDFYPFDNTIGSGKKVKIYCRKSIAKTFKNYAKINQTITLKEGTATRNHQPVVDYRVPRGTSGKLATICYPFAVEMPEKTGEYADNNIKAFIPLEYKKNDDDKLILVRARSIDDGYVPAYNAVLLHSKAGDVAAFDSESDQELGKTEEASAGYFLISEAAARETITFDDPTLNDNIGEGKKYQKVMIGTVEHTKVNPTNATYFYITKNGGYTKLTKEQEFPYFLGFLQFIGNEYQGKQLKFTFDWDDDEGGETTGIDDLNINENGEKAVYYNLQGQRVENPKHGVYIVNGKKVVLK